jgi:hypothetical protein
MARAEPKVSDESEACSPSAANGDATTQATRVRFCYRGCANRLAIGAAYSSRGRRQSRYAPVEVHASASCASTSGHVPHLPACNRRVSFPPQTNPKAFLSSGTRCDRPLVVMPPRSSQRGERFRGSAVLMISLEPPSVRGTLLGLHSPNRLLHNPVQHDYSDIRLATLVSEECSRCVTLHERSARRHTSNLRARRWPVSHGTQSFAIRSNPTVVNLALLDATVPPARDAGPTKNLQIFLRI